MVMSDDASGALRRLAARAGVIDTYHDAFGQHMVTSDAALMAALTALGWPLTAVEDAPRVLHDWDLARPVPLLPPVIVHRVGRGPVVVPLGWPETAGPGHWSILWEASLALPATEGFFDPATLPWMAAGPDHDGCRRLELSLPSTPWGYHRLRVQGLGVPAQDIPLILTPERCWLPEGTEDPETPTRLWGLTCQVHGLRGRRDWGMGDFGTLAALARQVGREGGDVLGINPVHALFPTRPLHASPYSPNSRLFLNPLYICIDDIPEAAGCPEIARLAADLEEVRAPDLVDHEAVAARKGPALEAAHARFVATEQGRSTPRAQAYAQFVAAGGVILERFAVFLTLGDLYAERGCSWRDWPAEVHDPESPAVAQIALEHRQRVDFHLWCQFEADRQLGRVAEVAAQSGQRLGLYRDLALGSDPTGADSWMLGDMLVNGLAVGAPPDPWNAAGQNWGFSPFHPERLRRAGYEPFARMIRATMRHAGALRIDHVLGQLRLFCIPRGMAGRDGLYLRMPFDDLLAVLALESHRARCLVVGEDLGTVPDGFRDRMHEAAILSCRLFYFERQDHRALIAPEAYPRLAAVSASTHDLPTLHGFWSGTDLAWKNTLGLFPSPAIRDMESMERHNDRPLIRETLAQAGQPLDPSEGFTPPANLVPAVTAWLARTPSLLVTVQIEDVLEEREQANLPGTLDEHPNWRRRVGVAVEDLEADGRLDRIARLFAASRRGTVEWPG
ncbi:4-alpha-glucanotransferase [Pararhodospirillum photometricum]|uniref:4-alpha-glucanotransferase n=1 Tax=Pararhodospirillum photometricum DSM 122 TaxID=1150469 RepID=H6SQ29_PARPM|nr:4-alpha-glucanotransferase [Pararhodospirillum photometricum]CCG07299.1 4-alpha-glucanotransferase [Pararhodospirillum photometricum DSM 122]